MKSKITRGAGFRGLLDYVFDIGKDASHGKDARLIGGNMVGDNPRALLAEFAALRRLRPDIKRPVWHSSLRLPSGETISDEKWNEFVQDYLTRICLNPDHHPYVVIMHNDSHVHVISSRIAFNGALYYGKNEHLIATRVVQQLEIDHGLTTTQGPVYDKDGKIVMVDKAKISSHEQKMAGRTGKIAPRQRLQEIITDAVKDRPTQAVFEKRLTEAGVSFRSGSNGYSYRINGIAFKGSQLGQAFKWAKLQKLLILPEQNINKEEQVRPLFDSEYHNLFLKKQAIYADRVVGWEEEQKRRDKYRANRSIIYSVGRLSAHILPRPLGESIKFGLEVILLIARINDWRQARLYKQGVYRLRCQLAEAKADRQREVEILATSAAELKSHGKINHNMLEIIKRSEKPTIKTGSIQINDTNQARPGHQFVGGRRRL